MGEANFYYLTCLKGNMGTQMTYLKWRYLSQMAFPKWRDFRILEDGRTGVFVPKFVRMAATATKVEKSPKKRPLKPVIGLEIHAQIHANSKLFSGAGSQFGTRVNSSVSHFDAAIPGTLPVINKRCVEAAVSTSLALGCKINLNSRFDRKHYFYADMPAGYQITQHFSPIARNGKLDYVVVPQVLDGEEEKIVRKSVRIIQVQIEQDSGKSIHDAANGVSLIDLNRAGMGLLEIVTAPDFEGSEDAVAFASELKHLLECLGVTDAKSGAGQIFRVDANVSLHRDDEPLGIRTEIKNMNSLKDVRNAIDFEINRQKKILDSGGEVINETLGYDRPSNRTLPMRDKEIVTDYRFFPEPNLPPLRLSTSRRFIPGAVDVDALAADLPELPEDVRQRLIERWRLTRRQSAALVSQQNAAAFFERAMQCLEEMMPDFLQQSPREFVPLPPPPKPCPPGWAQYWPFIHPMLCVTVTQVVADLILKRVLRMLDDRSVSTMEDMTINDLPLSPRHIASLAVMIEEGSVSPAAAPKILSTLSSVIDERETEDDSIPDVAAVVESLDLWMRNDEEWIRSLVREFIVGEMKQLVKDNPKKNARAKMTVIGKVLEASRLKANPFLVKGIVEEEIAKLKSVAN